MKSYVQQLNLNFDPFDVTASAGEFFEGGNRRVVLDRVVERAMYSESVISVSGCLGSGKTSLAKAISKKFADDAVIVSIVATLFMNADQFLDELATALALASESSGDQNRTDAVIDVVGRLQANASSLLIQIDDAHEMSAEVLNVLIELKSKTPSESLKIILFGESQLGNMLENSLEPDELAILAEFELESFGSEATIDYVRFKLASAGYTKPLPLSGNELGAIHNASQGMPGAINALVRDELEKQVEPDAVVVAVGSELEELEVQFSSDVSLDESDYTEAELEEFSAAVEVEVADAPEDEESAPATRYFIAAGVLLVVLVAAIVLFRPSQESQTATAQIEVAATPVGGSGEDSLSTISQRPRIIPEIESQSASLSSEPLNAAIDESLAQNQLELDKQSNSEPLAAVLDAEAPTLEDNVLASTVMASESTATESELALSEEITTTINPVSELSTRVGEEKSELNEPDARLPAPVVSNSSNLSPFEQGLLSEPSSNFTVQIVGALSEANIKAFVAANPLTAESGYFETRLNGKPWFVVVAGSFDSRESAAAMVESLPAAVKASGPWVRDLAGIQSDIRGLQAK